MVITMVIDVFDTLKNGTTITAHRFADELTRRGHQVRIVAIGDPQQNRYALKEKRIPIVSAISRKQGMCFAKPDDSVIRDALTGADVVHLFLPFALERRARKIAKEMGVPQCAAFHLQPENITYNIHLRWKFFARLIYRYFYLVFYRHFDHIHCPSRFIARQLRGAGYHARLHVISNGVDAGFCPGETRRPKAACFRRVTPRTWPGRSTGGSSTPKRGPRCPVNTPNTASATAWTARLPGRRRCFCAR